MSCDPKLQKKLDSTLGQRLGQHREIQRGQRGLASKLIHAQVAFHSCRHADSLGQMPNEGYPMLLGMAVVDLKTESLGHSLGDLYRVEQEGSIEEGTALADKQTFCFQQNTAVGVLEKPQLDGLEKALG